MEKEIWLTRDREKIHVSKMKTDHIVNSIMCIKQREIDFYNDKSGKNWIRVFKKELRKKELI